MVAGVAMASFVSYSPTGRSGAPVWLFIVVAVFVLF